MSNLTHHQIDSVILGRKRRIRVYTPSDYTTVGEPLPLITKHDGQLAFSERDSELPFGSWQLDHRMKKMIAEGLPGAVIVAIDNSAKRREEYFPVTEEFANYQRFLLEEVLPFVRDEYNVSAAAEDNFVMGSSMGGLVSFALAFNNPDVFSAAGCLSPWFEFEDYTYIKEVLSKWKEKPPIRVYMDSGIQDWRWLDDGHRGTMEARLECLRLGFVEGEDLLWLRDLSFPTEAELKASPVKPEKYEECSRNQHNEFFFGRRSEGALRFLLSGRV